MKRFKPYSLNNISSAPQWELLTEEQKEWVRIVGLVLPFRVNSYVLDELIDWENIPDDPMFRLTFPHKDMLKPADYDVLKVLFKRGGDDEIKEKVRQIRAEMNPHPAGQLTSNIPYLRGVPLPGLQHKYKETVLFFPSQGQSCHSYCTFCFRWPQFTGMDEIKFSTKDMKSLVDYLEIHKEVSDVLITGGDPMVMNSRLLYDYISALCSPKLSHIKNIRIGTKSLSYWPYRFLTDKDSDEILRVFETVVKSGRSISIMAHYNHPRELETNVAEFALKRVMEGGVTVRMQSPLIRHVNDDFQNWVDLWTKGVAFGAIPYYMFVERDTGAHDYFNISLKKAYDIFNNAYQRVSGLARTVRGPSMSAYPGKVLVDGVTDLKGEKVFALKFLQARNPSYVNRIFFARYDGTATWLDQLKPAFNEERFFFEEEVLGKYKSGFMKEI